MVSGLTITQWNALQSRVHSLHRVLIERSKFGLIRPTVSELARPEHECPAHMSASHRLLEADNGHWHASSELVHNWT